MAYHRFVFLMLFCCFLFSCREAIHYGSGFVTHHSETGVDFINQLQYTEEFNPYTYRNFYNGGGVALGDIDNDGDIDIYFTGNQVDNKLYLNNGDWTFTDITDQASVACTGVWSSGATFADINGDGLLDLYVCKAGLPSGLRRHNELFINNGDLTFTERSKEYGLDITGLSIHSAFFDYDRDGDLDCYLLNNSMRSVGAFDLKRGQREIHDPEGNKLLRNEGDHFVDVTQESGIYSSNIGYGLGITVSDFNLDSWPDLFISNDFFERDYLYINNQNGGFTEEADEWFESMSLGSMGADAADLDNDLLPELFVTEMLPSTWSRRKTKAVYDTWDKYVTMEKEGYHHQFPRNVLQRNLGAHNFVEIGRYTGVCDTDWSWAALIQDWDNDGLKDIFVSNGIYKDLLDRDYLTFMANDAQVKSLIDTSTNVIQKLIDAMPSEPVVNAIFKNQSHYHFEDVSSLWGLDQASFSNGSAYGDLDNDGDLDLIVNNVNQPAAIYENRVAKGNNYLSVKLTDTNSQNTQAIGSKVELRANDFESVVENFTSRGFQSSVTGRVHFGLGEIENIEELLITWPDGSRQKVENIDVNQILRIERNTDAQVISTPKQDTTSFLVKELPYRHSENQFNHFNREPLLTHMYDDEGPAMAVGDVNNDGRPDYFLGGGKYKGSQLVYGEGRVDSISFLATKDAEVVEALLFDMDSDGDLDIYEAHGSSTFSQYDHRLHDVIYRNDGQGSFTKMTDRLPFPQPVNTGAVAVSDYDQDGDLDLFISERFHTRIYGIGGNKYLLENQGNGDFVVVNSQNIFDQTEMVTDAAWADMNNDGSEDLVVVGDWSGVHIFYNENGKLIKTESLENSVGLWQCIKLHDIDQDGDMDIIAGNAGANQLLSKDVTMYINDFDNNGSAEQIICEPEKGKYYPIHDKDELQSQLPELKKKVVYYTDYGKSSMEDLFEKEILDKSVTFQLDRLTTMIFYQEEGSFYASDLPPEIQYSSVHAITVADINDDGIDDIILGGNRYKAKPQLGRDDASMGWIIWGRYSDGKIVHQETDPLYIKGEIRDIEIWGENKLIFGINDDKFKILEF